MGNLKKLKTTTIDARFKEAYYQDQYSPIKESEESLRTKQVFWNYMMNVSMQNTLAQMIKA